MPPAGFKGQQFVDNRGCVYLKAGYGGKTAWVPRVGRDRKALCGYPPTFGKQPVIEVAEDVAPAPAPAKPAAKPVVVAAAPAAKTAAPPAVSYTPAPYVPPAAAPVVVAAPAPYSAAPPKGTYERVAGNGAVPAGKIGCYTSAPVAERVRLRNGGTAVVCTRGDGSLDGWRPPIYPQGSPVGASLSDPPVAVARGRSQGSYVEDGRYAAATGPSPVVEPVPTPPPGYELAWKDDRLNPYRGVGTAEGWAQQDQVWTRKVPARLVADAGRSSTTVSTKGTAKGQVTVSTKSSPTAPVAQPAAKGTGRLYVQIGTFGVPANADGASSRLKAAGLPVARSKITSKGKAMQIVLAGPFASAAEAQAALRLARGAGFGDAFIR